MNLADLYLPIKHTHLLLVSISIVFFLIRAGAKLAEAQWLNKKWLRITPHMIDTVLLVSGILLMVITAQYPISQNWLSVKILLLLGYIVFAMKGMKSGHVLKQRKYFAAALSCVLLLITVAKTHHPLGLFSLL